MTHLVNSLLAWYQQNARDLPWRRCNQAYGIWVSEIMLQQTQVATVIPYYERWMARFPSIKTLAEADEQDVLTLWEGLGYYSRARHLHQAAKQVMQQHGGQFPQTMTEIRSLPGVGAYTAGAIASIAFGQDEAALDGNIRRVMARLFDISMPLKTPQSEKTLWALARQFLPHGRAGDYNQALMELGALICTAKKPACNACPVNAGCLAYGRGVQHERPVVIKKPPIPHYLVTAAVMLSDGKIFLARRPANGLLGGLWEFPGGKAQPQDADLAACLRREIMEELGVEMIIWAAFGVYRHAYTHFKVTLHAFLCHLPLGQVPQMLHHEAFAWAGVEELPQYPMGKIDRQIAIRLQADWEDLHHA